MRHIVLSLLFAFTAITVFSQTTNPVEVVQRQLDTYNAQDLDGFVEVFSEEVEVTQTSGMNSLR